MNTMNAITAKVTNCHQPLLPTLHHHRPIFFSRPISSLSFKSPYPSRSPSPSPSLSYAPIHAASSSSSPSLFPPNRKNPNPPKTPETLTNPQNPPLQFPFPDLKTTFIAAVTATALFFSRFHLFVKPVIAAPVSPPPVVEMKSGSVYGEGREKELEKHLESNPNDVDALRSLMEIRIKDKKIPEAISVIDRLIELEPKEVEWKLLKSHLYVYIGEVELAKVGFNEIISREPLRVEAYHGLVMAASQDDSSEELKGIEKRIEEGIKLAKKENKKNEVRDFKLLIAQIKVIEGKYDDALKVYQDLVKEEPRDFRPYLCQGIIYTLLRKNNEAEKNFEKYRRLVPKGHPYASYFDDNMIATKVFAQKAENERAGMKG